MMNMWTKRKNDGGRTMSLIHNRRMGAVTLAVAATVLLLGAGCSKVKPEAPAANAPPADAATIPAIDSGLPTTWAEYRSEALGITIPYPEGWYTRERNQDGALRVDIHPTTLPPFDFPSDAMAAVSVVVGSFDEETTIQAYGPTAERTQISLDGQSVTVLAYAAEFETPGAQNEYIVYLWLRAGIQYLVEGTKDDPIVLYTVRALIARPAEGGTP